jgi:hypothetical protein
MEVVSTIVLGGLLLLLFLLIFSPLLMPTYECPYCEKGDMVCRYDSEYMCDSCFETEEEHS